MYYWFLIKDSEGDLLFGKQLLIDASGLEGSERNSRDGFTYFGVKKKNETKSIIDFRINYLNESHQTLKFFSISFLRGINNFFPRISKILLQVFK